jgi:hypothetical protein
MQLGGGRSVQSYVDPRPNGMQDVHVTFFDASGAEVKVAKAPTVTAVTGDRESGLEVRRFGPGHFVASAALHGSKWRFQIVTSLEGQRISSCFEETIE